MLNTTALNENSNSQKSFLKIKMECSFERINLFYTQEKLELFRDFDVFAWFCLLVQKWAVVTKVDSSQILNTTFWKTRWRRFLTSLLLFDSSKWYYHNEDFRKKNWVYLKRYILENEKTKLGGFLTIKIDIIKHQISIPSGDYFSLINSF